MSVDINVGGTGVGLPGTLLVGTGVSAWVDEVGVLGTTNVGVKVLVRIGSFGVSVGISVGGVTVGVRVPVGVPVLVGGNVGVLVSVGISVGGVTVGVPVSVGGNVGSVGVGEHKHIGVVVPADVPVEVGVTTGIVWASNILLFSIIKLCKLKNIAGIKTTIQFFFISSLLVI